MHITLLNIPFRPIFTDLARSIYSEMLCNISSNYNWIPYSYNIYYPLFLQLEVFLEYLLLEEAQLIINESRHTIFSYEFCIIILFYIMLSFDVRAKTLLSIQSHFTLYSRYHHTTILTGVIPQLHMISRLCSLNVFVT